MPELPEVETIVCDLRPHLVGRRFIAVQVYWPGTIAGMPPEGFQTQLIGQRVEDITRRGKFVVMTLDGGWHLLMHLRMSGQLLLARSPLKGMTHLRLRFDLDDGKILYFRDVRKFGRAYLVSDPQAVVGGLGPEPLAEEFGCQAFAGLLKGRRGMIKSLLLNQRFLAGVGNIYADEALFAAGVDPRRRADSLSEEEIVRLYGGVRHVLQRAIANRGTTLDAYRDAAGQPGHNQTALEVFRRAEEPCPRCGASIQRTVIAGRGTYFCSHCQK